MDKVPIGRRRFLAAVGTTGVVVTAGCQDETAENADSDGGSGSDSTDDDQGTKTEENGAQEESSFGIYPAENDEIRAEYDADSLIEDHPIFEFDAEEHLGEDEFPNYKVPLDIAAMEHFYDENTSMIRGDREDHYVAVEAVKGEANPFENSDILRGSDGAFTPFHDRIDGGQLDGRTGEWNTDIVDKAETEAELLGWIHPLALNTWRHRDGRAPQHQFTSEIMSVVQASAEAHPNDEIGLHVFAIQKAGNEIGATYCKKEDSIRIVETSDFAETSESDDRQLHPKIENSNYYPEANPEDHADQTDAMIGLRAHEDHNWGNDASAKLATQFTLMNISALPHRDTNRDTAAPRDTRFNSPGDRNRNANVTLTYGLALDASESLREYNSNSVDWDDDIVPLSRMMDELERFTDEHWVIDYQPENEYNGELHGEYVAVPVDEDTFDEVYEDEPFPSDEERADYDNFVENHRDKIIDLE